VELNYYLRIIPYRLRELSEKYFRGNIESFTPKPGYYALFARISIVM
jgi:hypothetical protein